MCVTLVPSFHHCALSRWLQVPLVHSSLLSFCLFNSFGLYIFLHLCLWALNELSFFCLRSTHMLLQVDHPQLFFYLLDVVRKARGGNSSNYGYQNVRNQCSYPVLCLGSGKILLSLSSYGASWILHASVLVLYLLPCTFWLDYKCDQLKYPGRAAVDNMLYVSIVNRLECFGWKTQNHVPCD